MTQADTNPVGFLQEFVQKYNVAPFPKYMEVAAVGPDHSREFTYKCSYDGYEIEGSSRQKKQAKSEAAKNMIKLLKEKQYFGKHGFSYSSGLIRAIDGFNSSLQNGTSESVDIVNLPSTKNPISALQEYCQEKKLQFPDYFDTSTRGGFVCKCTLRERNTYGNGVTKRAAKTESAAKMCNELHISYSGVELVKKEETDMEQEEFESDKNPISALQELCQRKAYPTPVYEDKAMFLNQFVVMCTVGKVTKKGKGTSKKAAKAMAAQHVFCELSASVQENGYNGSTSKQSLTNGRVHDDSGSALEELILDNEDDDGHSDNQQRADDLSVSKTMESLNLDDSVVEVEPSRTITIHSNVRLLSDPPLDISAKTIKNYKASETNLQE